MKQRKWIFIGLMLFILWQVSLVGAVSVEPIVIKITAKPGEKVPFSVRFRSSENYMEIVKLSLAQPVQKPDGGLEFKPATPEVYPEIGWIDLSASQVNVAKGGEVEVNGVVKVPFKVRGYHTVAIMGEEPSKESGAFLVSIIYAIRLDINVDAPTPRLTAEISDFTLGKGEKSEPRLQFKAKNTSLLRLPTNAYVAIRSKSTKKLLEKVEMRPLSYWGNNLDPVIIPGATLLYNGYPKEVLLPGDYDLQLFFRFSTSGQILKTTSIQVKEKDFVYPAQKLRTIRVSPDDISVSGNPGTTAMKGIKLENRSDKPVKVMLKPVDVEAEYPYSALMNTKVELKNGSEFQLGPGRTAVAIVMVRFPKNAKIQGNYGLIRILALNSDGAKIEESCVNLEAVVPGKFIFKAEATNISQTRDGENRVFSAVIKNNGNIRIVPDVVASIKDSNGNYVSTIKLTGQDEKTVVLPRKLMTFSGNTMDRIAPGQYKAEIRILQGNGEIGRSLIDLKID